MNKNKLSLFAAAACLSLTAYAQDDAPQAFSYSTYYVCDVEVQNQMDDIVEKYEKPVFDQWVADGKLIAWGYLSHFTGGSWRKAQYHVSPTLEDAINTQATIFAEIYGANPGAGAARARACRGHQDYVWSTGVGGGAGPGSDRGDVSLSVYYVCDQAREAEADEIVAEHIAPLYDAQVEAGKLKAWGWLSHVLGGEYRRLATATGDSHSDVLAARGEIIAALQDNDEAEEFSQICSSHSDYLWNIAFETP